jgi:hypothetical protein
MFITREGIYQNGATILTELAPIKENCEVLISQPETISTSATCGDYAT